MKSNQKDAWSLVREATMFLREKERELASWRQKKWRRIKEEEKEDRLSVSKMTKKRFGIKKLSNEESLRFRTRKKRGKKLQKQELTFGGTTGSRGTPRPGTWRRRRSRRGTTSGRGSCCWQKKVGDWIGQGEHTYNIRESFSSQVASSRRQSCQVHLVSQVKETVAR